MIKPGKRTEWNRQANKICKQWCIVRGITRCEICGTDFALSFAHRKKRRHYNSLAELTDEKEWVLACIDCHNKYLEWDTEVRDIWFDKLRGTIR